MEDQDLKIAKIKREIDKKALKPPPNTISIPSPDNSFSSSVDKTASMGSDSLDESFLNDSFYQKLDSEKFYIDTIEEDEEASFPSRVDNENIKIETELSNQQLLDLVESLYDNLKHADSVIQKEKSRRRSREKTIIKLAKELTKHTENLNQQRGQIDEMREELRVAEAEKSLLDQRLSSCLIDLRKSESDIRKVYESQRREELEMEKSLMNQTSPLYSGVRGQPLPHKPKSRLRKLKLRIQKKPLKFVFSFVFIIFVLYRPAYFTVPIPVQDFVRHSVSDGILVSGERLWVKTSAFVEGNRYEVQPKEENKEVHDESSNMRTSKQSRKSNFGMSSVRGERTRRIFRFLINAIRGIIFEIHHL